MNQQIENFFKIHYIQADADTAFEEKIKLSISKIQEFAQKYHLTSKTNFLKEVFLYGTKITFDDFIKSRPDWKTGAQVPMTYVGFGEKEKVHIVDWKTYKNIFPKQEAADYQKLITHEFAHLFHIHYLNRDEDKMGPKWFYEGFACLVANQFSDAELPLKDEIQKILEGTKNGNYKQYTSIVKQLSKKMNVKELLDFASKEKFTKIAIELLST